MKNKLIVILSGMLFVTSANSQNGGETKQLKDVSISVTQAVMVCPKNNQKELHIMFDKSLKIDLLQDVADENQKATNYHLIKLSNGEKFELAPKSVGTDLQNFLFFNVSDKVDPNEKKPGLALISNNQVIVKGSKETISSLLSVAISDSCKTLPDKLPSPTAPPKEKPNQITYYGKKFFNYTKPENKDNAEVKLKFSLDGTKPKRRYFALDLDVSPFRLHRLGLAGAYDWERAYLKVRYSSQNSVDTVEVGTRLTHFRIFHDDGERIAQNKSNDKEKLFAGIVSVFNPRIETDRKFNEINAVFRWDSGLPINLIQTRSRTLRIKPYIGVESGYKLKSKSEEDRGNWILRPLFGAELFYIPFRSKGKEFVTFEANYVRRAFLKEEPFYVLDENDKEMLAGNSKGAKDYGSAKLTFRINSVISPFIEYEYGRQPTKYILIDNRYRVGLETNFDWKWNK